MLKRGMSFLREGSNSQFAKDASSSSCILWRLPPRCKGCHASNIVQSFAIKFADDLVL